MTDDYKCEVCGVDLTSAMMAAMCPLRERCEFWPDDKESQDFLDALGIRYVASEPPAEAVRLPV